MYLAALLSAAVVAAGTPPVNATLPAISGTAREGQTLTTSSGSWGGTLPISYDYTWQRCDTAGAGCAGISGAHSTTYKLGSADVGHTLRVRVTASNNAGSSAVSSAPTGTVAKAGSAPAASGQPSPSGSAQVGQTLTAENGSHKTYTIVGADLGQQLRYLITAHNSVGTGTMNSNLSAVVSPKGAPPENLDPPVITGDPTVGKVVQTSSGTWSGIGKSAKFSYAWDRCTTAGACSAIAGARSSTYVVAAADQGYRLRSHVTATNAEGSTSATSAQVAVANSSGGGSGAVVPVTSLKANPDHLLISDVKFNPSPFGNPGGSLTIKVKVMLEGTNKAVSGALVYVTCVPYNWVKGQPPETPTGADGWVSLKINTSKSLPHSGTLVMQVRARGPGNSETDILGGISTRRLVQVSLK